LNITSPEGAKVRLQGMKG